MAAVAALLAVTGCGSETEPTRQPVPVLATETIDPDDPDLPAAREALTLIPADATAVTVTDFDAVRAALGVPGLTSEDLMSDRTAFWERAREESVLLAEGRLREDNSLLMLDYGFTQDDVDWEAAFTTESGSGWIVALRPDLELDGVGRAIADGVAGLGGAELDPDRHLVTRGTMADDTGDETLAETDAIAELIGDEASESTYLRAGCVPLADALGPDADVEDLDALLAEHDPTDFAPLDRFAVSFGGGLATARLGRDRTDLDERAALATDFPVIGGVDFADAMTDPVLDPSTGRIGWTVGSPLAAARAALTDHLPFAVCNEVAPMEEPTGL